LPSRDPGASLYATCAVVGNGGTVRGGGAGERIDAHEAVWRFNWPLMTGFESDVGTRTTHMLVNRKSIFRSHWPPFTSHAAFDARNLTVFAQVHFPEEFVSVLRWMSMRHAPIVYAVSVSLRSRVSTAVSRGAGELVASTGAIGVVLAMNLCKVLCDLIW
jgi:hypothetical protein